MVSANTCVVLQELYLASSEYIYLHDGDQLCCRFPMLHYYFTGYLVNRIVVVQNHSRENGFHLLKCYF